MNAQQKRTLELLDFDGTVRCDTKPTEGLSCRQPARFSLRCRNCDEIRVHCAEHMKEVLSAVNDGGWKAWCPGCKKVAGKVGDLFEMEPIG